MPARRQASGPAPVPKPAPARPAPANPGPAKPARRIGATTGTAAAALRPRGAAVLDALLRGRGWIAIVFVLLAGIVFFNVDLLQLNREIARTADRAGAVKRENARLRALNARLGSSERIQREAAAAGLLMPAPGEVRYLRSNPPLDAGRAAARIDRSDAVASPGAAAPTDPQPAESVPDAVPPAPVQAAVDPATGAPTEPAPVVPEAVAPEAAPPAGGL